MKRILLSMMGVIFFFGWVTLIMLSDVFTFIFVALLLLGVVFWLFYAMIKAFQEEKNPPQ